MKKDVCILGSTGSVGTQGIEVVRERGFRLTGICAHSNIALLEEQIREFHPLYCAVRNEEKARAFYKEVNDRKIYWKEEQHYLPEEQDFTGDPGDWVFKK